MRKSTLIVCLTAFGLVPCRTAGAQTPAAPPPAPPTAVPVLTVPRLTAPPVLEDFLDAGQLRGAARTMARVDRFIQRWPSDGAPARMATIGYLGYTADALHVVFVATDPDPTRLRAHRIRREEVFVVNDDAVELRIDTFGDGRESYYFVVNPLGAQLDAAWPEVGGQYDESFDAVWHSAGIRTKDGFIAMMSIPFKSLRFKPGEAQTWGIYLGRWIPRTGEWVFWPSVSGRQQSYLRQMARLEGLGEITRGRGIQLIPYVSSRGFEAIDARDPAGPRTMRDLADARAGIDAKLVLRDAMVLDVTANPDFSQVESDAPQITANQRFEVFFPEKRPFFLENAGYFRTPINLLFTRRIGDPDAGARLTGRTGAWTLGALVSDDTGPGQRLPADDARRGDRAWAGVARVSRSLGGQSSVGAILTRRTFGGRTNTVAGVDTSLRLGTVWSAQAQWAASWLESAAQAEPAIGSAYAVTLRRNGRSVTSSTAFGGRGARFASDLGFVPRVGVHELTQTLGYTFRPAALVNDWGPSVTAERIWAADGTPLDWRVRPAVTLNSRGATSAGAFIEMSALTLRPGDAPNVTSKLSLRADTWGGNFSTSPRPWWSAGITVTRGRGINFGPPDGLLPEPGGLTTLQARVGVRPLTPLRLEATWLRSSLRPLDGPGRVFVSDIARTQWAWQFTRAWSVRFIAQYEITRPTAALTTLAPRRNLNADLLVTRLLHPGTAVHVGVNSNRQNLAIVEIDPGRRGLRRIDHLATDAWQVFVKYSHLLRW